MMKKTLALAGGLLAAGLGFSGAASAQYVVPFGAGNSSLEAPPSYGGSADDQVRQIQRNIYIRQGVPFDPQTMKPLAGYEWQRLGLWAPPPGYGWYQYGNNNYALVQLASGVISQLFNRR